LKRSLKIKNKEKGYIFSDVGHMAISFNGDLLETINIDMQKYGGIFIEKRY
jgi:hypothetical protein